MNLFCVSFLSFPAPDEHHAFLTKRGFQIPRTMSVRLASTDTRFLQDYGFYLLAIWMGDIEPVNDVQRAFSAVHTPSDPLIARAKDVWRHIVRKRLEESGELVCRIRLQNRDDSWVQSPRSRHTRWRDLGA